MSVTMMEVLLIHHDGACWSPLYPGDGLYPRLSATPVRLRLLKSGGPISHGDAIRITTTEPQAVRRGQHVLGAWTAKWLYYSENLEGDNQDFRIYRAAGPGLVAYGDEIYLVNVHYNQRVGRLKGEIWLTSGDELTDTFTIADPAAPPLVTSFNALDQVHGAGEPHSTDSTGWVWRMTDPGQEMLTVETTLPAGSYHALLQFEGDTGTGKHCATIRVQSGGKELVSRQLHPAPHPDAGWQRALVPFTTASSGVAKIAVTAATSIEKLWTGALSITPAGQRPFYVIAHACNTVESAYEAVRAGANAIEFDITPVLDGSRIRFDVYHPPIVNPNLGILGGTAGVVAAAVLESPRTPFADYINGIMKNGVANQVALLHFDAKTVSGISSYDYGYQLASEAKRLGIDPRRAFFAVEKVEHAADFYRGVKDAGMFNGARDVSDIETGPSQWTDPATWYNVGAARGNATFLGVGVDAKVFWSPMGEWFEPVSYTTVMRDRDQRLKKVYFWTLDEPESMRSILDLNVDGIIVNDPAKLVAVLKEQPYAEMFRLATVNDSLTTVYGWPALSGPAAPPAVGA